jgi:hypothetical protein
MLKCIPFGNSSIISSYLENTVTEKSDMKKRLKMNSSFCWVILWFESDVSGLPISPIFKGQAVKKKLLGQLNP